MLRLFYVKIALIDILVLLSSWECDAMFEEIEVTPNYSGGFWIGDLSWAQFLLINLIFLQLVVLYSIGVLPVEVQLGDIQNFLVGRSLTRREICTTAASRKMELTEFLRSVRDCPAQYVCDLDFWAHKKHDSFIENSIAYWFRNSNNTFTNPDLATYAGGSTCSEMYPCPIDIQDVVGFHIPGSRTNNTSSDMDLQIKLF